MPDLDPQMVERMAEFIRQEAANTDVPTSRYRRRARNALIAAGVPEMQQENERLRKALERIATQVYPEEHLSVVIARAALAELADLGAERVIPDPSPEVDGNPRVEEVAKYLFGKIYTVVTWEDAWDYVKESLRNDARDILACADAVDGRDEEIERLRAERAELFSGAIDHTMKELRRLLAERTGEIEQLNAELATLRAENDTETTRLSDIILRQDRELEGLLSVVIARGALAPTPTEQATEPHPCEPQCRDFGCPDPSNPDCPGHVGGEQDVGDERS